MNALIINYYKIVYTSRHINIIGILFYNTQKTEEDGKGVTAMPMCRSALHIERYHAVPCELVRGAACAGWGDRDALDHVEDTKLIKGIGDVFGCEMEVWTFSNDVECEAGDESAVNKLLSGPKLAEGTKRDTAHAAWLVPDSNCGIYRRI
jgi:hypothetical protein